ncbi:HAMP domain-containing sensor histidine kinase [Aureimonas sp. AU20]|uniref:ATP-binding protein n=1 Tax=Aureimonas sp. AU20 TaxID=1349819 RepID=UPI000722D2B7|nr:HAMP domain-containing sensor histidine kinase [Aureimonas sp. AU20]ALN71877.1 hypothetical protein M673_04065 [Aureimonas sp. AU20]
MKLKSLRLRLILGAAVWIAAALLVAGVAIGFLFAASIERGARSDLDATLSRLVALIDPEATSRTPRLAGSLPDARYDTPISGAYWQVTDTGNRLTLRSRSLWDHVLQPNMSGEGESFFTATGPDGHALLALSRPIRFETKTGERRYLATVAQDRSFLDEMIARFGRELAVALLILGGVLGVATTLQVQLGLAPLKQLRIDVESVRKGAAVSVEAAYPSEVVPLVTEVNELLASQDRSLDFARSRAADLAHGLKTPLSVLGTIAYELEVAGDLQRSVQVFELAEEMRDRIDYQMRLARLRHRTRMHTFNASVSEVAARTAAVLRKTRKGEELRWVVDVADDLNADIDSNDLVELVGVVLENAVEWARSEVCIRAQAIGSVAELQISDDGPGIEAAEIATIGIRGKRLDETKPGTGLGLSIAREILALNDGTISFERSAQGGLAAIVRLPIAPSSG